VTPSLAGQVFDTHEAMIKLQDKIIDMKKTKLQQMQSLSDIGLVDVSDPFDDTLL